MAVLGGWGGVEGVDGVDRVEGVEGVEGVEVVEGLEGVEEVEEGLVEEGRGEGASLPPGWRGGGEVVCWVSREATLEVSTST